jgi:hypothetical protein
MTHPNRKRPESLLQRCHHVSLSFSDLGLDHDHMNEPIALFELTAVDRPQDCETPALEITHRTDAREASVCSGASALLFGFDGGTLH